MGQAKNRGTREQRVAMAIARDQRIAEEYERARIAWWDSLTPEERQARISKSQRQAEALSFLTGFGSMGLLDSAFWGPPRLKRKIEGNG